MSLVVVRRASAQPTAFRPVVYLGGTLCNSAINNSRSVRRPEFGAVRVERLTVVVGSAPDIRVPLQRPDFIYAANRAVLRVRDGGDVCRGRAHLSSVVGAREILEPDLQSAIAHSFPDRVIVRGNLDSESLALREQLKGIPFECLDPKGISVQRAFFTPLSLVSTNYAGKRDYLSLRRFWNSTVRFRTGGVTGLSTGVFCALLAALEVPEGPIVMTGISFVGGAHFYSSGEMRRQRTEADLKLVKVLDSSTRARLFVTSQEVADISGLTLFSGNLL